MKQTLKAAGLVLLLSLSVAACNTISMVEKGKTVSIADVFTVTTDVDWNELTGDRGRVWTVDGFALQQMSFFVNIKDGEPVYNAIKGDEEKRPVFKKEMSPLEIKELIETSYARMENQKVQITNFRPSPFGNKDGFRFDTTYLTKNGLKMKGFILATVFDDVLHLIDYHGAAIHYFDKNKEDAEKVIRSISFENGKSGLALLK